LAPADPDADWAQHAAVLLPLTLTDPAYITARTFSWGGGVQANSNVVAASGFAPYLSLFDGSGKFLASTYLGETCPSGAGTSDGNCYDVMLDGGTRLPGNYYVVVTAFQNLSLAENYLGVLTLNLSDGFTFTGQLDAGRDLRFALDVNLGPPIPEPGAALLAGSALATLWLMQKGERNHEKQDVDVCGRACRGGVVGHAIRRTAFGAGTRDAGTRCE
jgi:hypothetical protein